MDLVAGQVVLINAESGAIELGRQELWPSESWIGTVLIRRDEFTLVEVDGRLKKVPTSDHDYREQNTVEGTDSEGVTAVLLKDAVRANGFKAIGETVADDYRVQVAPTEDFDDFGGMDDVVDRARELIEVSLEHHDDLVALGSRPIKGVLFTGPPGTGKTMLARIIANRAGATFYEVSGPALIDKYFGESEKILREIFKAAAIKARSIIFFDEIDSIAPQRSGESHEASRRVVAQLLSLMDGFQAENNVVVIATTNRADDIDPALRRPGRFDWELFFTLPDTQSRERILQAVAKKMTTTGVLDHREIAAQCEGWSGADLTAIWTEAAILAVKADREAIFNQDYWDGFTIVRRQRELKSQSTQGGASRD
jgi:transitional endoplasmic reticulum ATPase